MIMCPIATVTAAAGVLLMMGAAGYHRRACDLLTAIAPGVMTRAAAAAVVWLGVTQ
jgi:hypothetical protein